MVSLQDFSELLVLTHDRYVLSTTHLHEFKSADKGQAPVMSLYLPEQKLGSHSNEGGSSNKFILKGRQTGSMHRGHTWVFRAESHDTMMAWYADIKTLTETSPEERSQFVRSHSRSLSQSSRRSASSDGMLDEDDDEEPFSASSQIDVNPNPKQDAAARRSQAGGRFPSDLQVNAQRGLQAPHSPSSVGSGFHDQPSSEVLAADGLPAGTYSSDIAGQIRNPELQERPGGYGAQMGTPIDNMPSQAAIASHDAQQDGVNPYTSESVQQLPTPHQQPSTYVVPVIASRELQQPNNEPANSLGNPGSTLATQEVLADEVHQNTNGYANGKAPSAMLGLASGNVSTGQTYVSEMEASVPDSEDQSLLADTPVPMSPVRPTGTNTRTDSVQTISNLHIPGGYPRERAS